VLPKATLAVAWRAVADDIRGQGPYFRLEETGRMLAARTEPILDLLRAEPELTASELRDRVREIAGPVAADERSRPTCTPVCCSGTGPG
jgi:hypothetical protein